MNLLLVGAADNNRRYLAAYLGLQDGVHIIGQAANAVEAITAARSLHPDVVIIDIDTTERTEGSGVESDCLQPARLIVGQRLAGAVIFMAVRRDARAARAARDAGVYAFIAKDAGVDGLIRTLNDLERCR